MQDPHCLRCQPQVIGACLVHHLVAAGAIGHAIEGDIPELLALRLG